MKTIIAVILGLVITLGFASPGQAVASHQVVLPAPSVIHVGRSVILKGRVPGAVRRVRLEQLVGHRWSLLGRAGVRRGHYSVLVRPAARASAVRAVSAGSYSAARLIPTSTAVPSDACGARPRKADGTYWACSFHDDFSGTSLNRSLWLPQTNFASGTQAVHACYLDDPSVINQSGGYLNLMVRKVATPVDCTLAGVTSSTDYVAGMISTYRLFSQQYGRFEARMKNTATTSPGLQEDFWMWPDDRYPSTAVWPTAGEIDVSETYSAYPTLSVPFLHYSADSQGPVAALNTAYCTAYRGQWNTYTLVWSATRLEILVNGHSCLVNTSADPAFAKPYILALTAALGGAGNEYDGNAPLPATTQVDYVRAWK